MGKSDLTTKCAMSLRSPTDRENGGIPSAGVLTLDLSFPRTREGGFTFEAQQVTGKDLCWSFIVKTLSWSVIIGTNQREQALIRERGQISFSRQASTHATDGVLNAATRIALQEAVDFLQQEKGMSAADDYALSSLAVDLGIGEAVEVANLVYAKIRKNIFKRNPDFWYKTEENR